jgi:4'-phosphopantetheinyl transferase
MVAHRTSAIDTALAIDWRFNPACGICRDIAGLTLAIVPLGPLLRHYLPGIPVKGLAQARPLTLSSQDFTRHLLSAQELARINVFKSRKRQIEWLAGRLAAKSLAHFCTDPTLALPDARIAYHPEGAPYLEQRPDLSLSISHAGAYAVAGLVTSIETALGLDIEQTRALDIASILPVAFSDRERQLMAPGDQDRFFACWTLKEAYLKYLGRGFRDNLQRVEILGLDTIRHHGRIIDGLRIQRLRPFPEYTLAIVTGPRPEVR